MGDHGENLLSYIERLILEMDLSGWVTMTVAEATILYWLKDVNESKKNQAELSDKVQKAWDVAKIQGQAFNIHDFLKIARVHWDSVLKNILTLSGPQNKGQVTTGDT